MRLVLTITVQGKELVCDHNTKLTKAMFLLLHHTLLYNDKPKTWEWTLQ
ncbi:MAG: hypothetical protein ACQJCO_03245 [cyanobacterium endosymbiont of Rhopalodia sterrenbergii]